MSMMVAVILSAGGMSGVPLIAVGSLVVGVAMVFFPAIAHPFMKQITGPDDVALGFWALAGKKSGAKGDGGNIP